jgi:hypothetical protein
MSVRWLKWRRLIMWLRIKRLRRTGRLIVIDLIERMLNKESLFKGNTNKTNCMVCKIKYKHLMTILVELLLSKRYR